MGQRSRPSCSRAEGNRPRDNDESSVYLEVDRRPRTLANLDEALCSFRRGIGNWPPHIIITNATRRKHRNVRLTTLSICVHVVANISGLDVGRRVGLQKRELRVCGVSANPVQVRSDHAASRE